MKINKNILMRKRRGFTLIELVIVVAILGVLSSVALIKFNGIEEKSKLNADYITAKNIATAAKLAINNNECSEDIDINYLVEKDYLDSVPKVQSQKDKKFEVYKQGEDIQVKIDQKIFYPKAEK